MTICKHKVDVDKKFVMVETAFEVESVCVLCGNDVYALWIDEREDKSAHWSAWMVRK